ncbi:MAG: tRNA (guanosine(37)-N1)-methyltransferase TrmD [Candidatus Ratteibacteria bacterium]|nr:tRNA (guanosine(37)-N1)-methyltransferase TrmD [Candidatus Ratteibacteria bacterium]
MKIDVLTLFPDMFRGPLEMSMLKRARAKKAVNIRIFDIRYFTKGKHRLADDYSYGGGSGMIMKPEPIFEAVKAASGESYSKLQKKNRRFPWIILLSPQGVQFTQKKAKVFAGKKHLIFICGRYKGIDERVRRYLINEEISIGDYVLSGGEAAAWVITEAVTRLIPGVVGDKESVETDSFYRENIFDWPHYTRPFKYRGWPVPKILISGNHKKIQVWRRKKALEKTFSRRPDLLLKEKNYE